MLQYTPVPGSSTTVRDAAYGEIPVVRRVRIVVLGNVLLVLAARSYCKRC